MKEEEAIETFSTDWRAEWTLLHTEPWFACRYWEQSQQKEETPEEQPAELVGAVQRGLWGDDAA